MLQTITCAIKSKDRMIIQQFMERLASARIKAIDRTAIGSPYTYFDLCWDDADASSAGVKCRAGAKPRKLLYEGVPATCGLVWQMRSGGMSDAVIGQMLDTSESTISRRRKKHLADGDFCRDSKVIF